MFPWQPYSENRVFSNLEFGFSVVLGNNNSNNKPTTTSKSKIAKPRRGSLDNIKLGGGRGWLWATMNFNTFSCINFSLFAKKKRHASESTKLTSVDVRKYCGILFNYFYQANGANYELLDLYWASQRRHYFYITRDSFGQGNKFVFFNFF